jgi:hypothetical protein
LYFGPEKIIREVLHALTETFLTIVFF